MPTLGHGLEGGAKHTMPARMEASVTLPESKVGKSCVIMMPHWRLVVVTHEMCLALVSGDALARQISLPA